MNRLKDILYTAAVTFVGLGVNCIYMTYDLERVLKNKADTFAWSIVTALVVVRVISEYKGRLVAFSRGLMCFINRKIIVLIHSVVILALTFVGVSVNIIFILDTYDLNMIRIMFNISALIVAIVPLVLWRRSGHAGNGVGFG